jgi:hypothetical protein
MKHPITKREVIRDPIHGYRALNLKDLMVDWSECVYGLPWHEHTAFDLWSEIHRGFYEIYEIVIRNTAQKCGYWWLTPDFCIDLESWWELFRQGKEKTMEYIKENCWT